MQRRSRLQSKTPLRQGTKGLTTRRPLQSGGELRRASKPKTRRRGRKRTAAEVAQMERWHQIVTADKCVMCQAIPVDQEVFAARRADILRREGHHILAKRLLIAAGLEHLLWDSRNGMSLCRLHHQRHEAWFQRVPRRLVPPPAFAFAAEVGMVPQLERDYPHDDGPKGAAA